MPVNRRVLLVALLAISAMAVFLGDLWIRTARVPDAAYASPPATPVVTDFRGRPLAIVGRDNARVCLPVDLAEMGPWLPTVTIALEDRRFRSHPGVDFFAVSASLIRNFRAGRVVAGGSTITQQLIKLASGSPARTLPHKLQEVRAALRLERSMDKQRILANYLNHLDYGNRRIGPAAASHAYFGKPPSRLSFAEAVFLAGLPRSPTRLNPWKAGSSAQEAYHSNIRRLSRMGMLPPGVTEKMLPPPPRVLPQAGPVDEARQFVHEVLRRARSPDGSLPPEIQTSLDLDLQKSIELLARSHRHSSPGLEAADLAVVVVDVAGGGVRAFVSVGESSGICAPTTPRSAGSTLKPFLYCAAISGRDFTAASLLPDTPDSLRRAFPDYDPRNFSHRYLGPVRLREALANSLNVPAVHVLARMGARRSFAMMRNWGFDFDGGFDASGAGFILGNVPVSALELAGAYAALARGGMAWPPVFWVGEKREPVRAADAASCMIIADILCDNDARSRSFGRTSPLAIEKRTAAKTGTSSGFRDAWCAGFTGSHAVVVWVGRMDGRPLPGTLAVRTAAPLWAAVVRLLFHRGDSPVPVPVESDELVSVPVCPLTGLLPDSAKPFIREWFLRGTAPEEPASSQFENGTLILPPEYAMWCAGPHNHLGAKTNTGRLTILYPPSHATFLLTPSLPAERQAIVPTASDKRATWFLNGVPLAVPRISLHPGTHTLEARLPGESTSITFSVEE